MCQQQRLRQNKTCSRTSPGAAKQALHSGEAARAEAHGMRATTSRWHAIVWPKSVVIGQNCVMPRLLDSFKLIRRLNHSSVQS